MNYIKYIINCIIAGIVLEELWKGIKYLKIFLADAEYGMETGVMTAFYVIMTVITLVMISFIVQNALRFIVQLKYGGQNIDSVLLVRIADKIYDLLRSVYQLLLGLVFGVIGAICMFMPGMKRSGPEVYVISGVFLVFALCMVIWFIRNTIRILKNSG